MWLYLHKIYKLPSTAKEFKVPHSFFPSISKTWIHEQNTRKMLSFHMGLSPWITASLLLTFDPGIRPRDNGLGFFPCSESDLLGWAFPTFPVQLRTKWIIKLLSWVTDFQQVNFSYKLWENLVEVGTACKSIILQAWRFLHTL